MDNHKYGLKAPLFASLSLAFASFGDAFLYPFLPVNHAAVGVPVVWIGMLLSINRFVRIFTNTWMVHLLAKYGLRPVTIFAVLLGIISTAGYAVAENILLWLLLRIVWGLAFSALRISTIGYSLQQSQQGFALGLTRGIQEMGPMLALFLAPVLLQHFNPTHIFVILTILSLPASYFAWNLPTHGDKIPVVTNRRSMSPIPSLLNSTTFVSAFLIDGMIVVVLGIIFLHHKAGVTLLTATSLAALYLGYRRVCLVLLSPVGGWMADRIGLRLIYNITLFMMIAGLVILILGWIEIGAIITFTFYSMHAAITPGYSSVGQDHPLASVAENATWRDLGAAVGTLAGGLLLSSSYLYTVQIFTIFGLIILFMFHWGTAQRTFKFLYLWK